MTATRACSTRLGRTFLVIAMLAGVATSSVRSEVAHAETGLVDTTYTHIQATVDNQAAWANFTLSGVTVMASKVVSVTQGMSVVDFGGNSVGLAGAGRAVVELVLRIAPGAAPAMRFCKNYLGPATVTITRITDAPAVVASVTNTSTSYAVPAGGCEGQLDRALSRADLIGPVRWPARRDARPLVLAAYHPWFDVQDGALQRSFGGDHPTGPADTHDAASVAAAVDLAAASGINAFLVDYSGTRDDEPLGYLYDAADRRGGFQVALMIDLDILRYLHGSLDRRVLDMALGGVAARAGRASQLRMGRDPVVFVYGAHLVDPNEWQGALRRLARTHRVTPFVVADDARLAAPGRFQYGTYNAPLARWGTDSLQQHRLQPEINGATPPLWVAPVSPGYDDRMLGRQPSLYIDRGAGVRFNEAWTASLSSLPDWILVTSWNEYYEQTHVIPGSSTGTLALDQVTTWSDTFRRNG